MGVLFDRQVTQFNGKTVLLSFSIQQKLQAQNQIQLLIIGADV